ncbi:MULTISPECIES: VOC family protein [Streptomyces]|uniref:VOC family protein n=1 Tax=Streptomyces xanthii TaxID=2768069 RepID=A0A7H1B219_9ACTN|nr:VOC family protein [Streptomyces xanthii]QNS02774.1 VOC family protein [Streptomyces xanthii]
MPPSIGSIDQLGYVVKDVEAAMRHWTTNLGVGPFFYFPQAAVGRTFYLGEPTDARIAVGIAQAGDVQIELIQQLNPQAPSAYRDFLEERGEGLHHVGHFVTGEGDDTYDAFLARFAEADVEPYHHGDSGPGSRFAYLPTEEHGGTVVEVIETAQWGGFFDAIRAAAAGWDGSDPVREITVP